MVTRFLETQGDTIKRVNLNNDRGIHVCKSMLAYKKWGNNKEPNKKSDHFIGDFYVMFSKKLKDNPELEQEAQEMLRKWESKDPETISLWKKMNKWAFQGFKETYKKFGIKFDKEYYESKTYSKGKQIIQENEKKGLFTKDETGATIIDLGEKLGNKVLLRSDGTTVYITQDLYLAQLKHDDFKYHKSIYVVGNEQNYHFEVLFKILKILKYPFADNCYHLSYGMVNLPEGKMKSREGTVVDADDLMDNLQELALKEIQERDIAKTKQDKLAKNISLSALKYYLLKYSAHKDFTFNPKDSVSFEGDTGPYIQYTYVRANKILKRMRLNQKNIAYNKLVLPQELNLIKKLADFPMIIEKSAKQLSPHIIAEYTYQLASLFNQFYEHCPVIKEPNVYTLHTRLNVVQAYTKVVKKALNLLGIEVVNEM